MKKTGSGTTWGRTHRRGNRGGRGRVGDAGRTVAGAEPETNGAAPPAMQAATFVGNGGVTLRTLPTPDPGPGEVRIRLEGCGVCPSNLPPWEGRPWFEYPFPPGAPGHEGWGVVDAVGDGVVEVVRGQRVVTLSGNAYAQYTVASTDEIVRLPEVLDGLPFPGEPLGCAMNIFRRAGIRPGHTVAIVGVGFLGALLTRLASRAGAHVIGISRRPFALEIARHFGAAETVALNDPEKAEVAVRHKVGGEGCDRVIEATGKSMPLELAGKLTRVRGRLIVAGYHQDGDRSVDMQLWNWKGLDVINAHERDPAIYLRGVQAAVRAVAAGTLDPSPLYTHTFPLDGLGDALRLVNERPDGFLKALVAA